MSHSIAGRIRSLERKLARPLTRVKASPHVNRLLDGWRAAHEHKSRLPDPFRFVSRLIRSGASTSPGSCWPTRRPGVGAVRPESSPK